MLWLLLACQNEDEIVWTPFNSDDNKLEIEVGVDQEQPAVSATLTSTTGEIQVGLADVSPGGGPIGTIHHVRVELFEDYALLVGRASVRTFSGSRGEDEYDLLRDSAGPGIWVYDLESTGEIGETRTDTFQFRLWEESDSGGQ